MARLMTGYPDGHWKYNRWKGELTCDCTDIMDCISKENADLDALDSNRLMKFPVADGEAIYYVVKEKPLTLQHVPYGDGYSIPNAHMRGLTYSDLQNQQQWQRAMKLFRETKENVNV